MLDVDMWMIVGSLTCAFLHGIIEFIFLGMEAEACKTNILHYSIVCFNARFGWIPFNHLFSSLTGSSQSSRDNNIDYENITSSLFKQQFEVEFEFTKSSAQTLINCISKLPMEKNPDKRKNVTIGPSMDDVNMDKLIDLVEMSNQRINLFMDGINVNGILNRNDSSFIMKKLTNPGKNDEKLLLRMIKLGRAKIVKEMINLRAKTNLEPEPL
jgi:hypothetical protein